MTSMSPFSGVLLDALGQCNWTVTEQDYSGLTEAPVQEVWIDHTETAAVVNIDPMNSVNLPLELKLVQVFDTSVKDFDGAFGTELANAYRQILKTTDVADIIQPVMDPRTIVKVHIEEPDTIDPQRLGKDLDTIASRIDTLHDEIFATVKPS